MTELPLALPPPSAPGLSLPAAVAPSTTAADVDRHTEVFEQVHCTSTPSTHMHPPCPRPADIRRNMHLTSVCSHPPDNAVQCVMMLLGRGGRGGTGLGVISGGGGGIKRSRM